MKRLFLLVSLLLFFVPYINTVAFFFRLCWETETGNLGDWRNINIRIAAQPSLQPDQSVKLDDIMVAAFINGTIQVGVQVGNKGINYLLEDKKEEKLQLKKLYDTSMQQVRGMKAILNLLDKDHSPRAQKIRQQIKENEMKYLKRKNMHMLEKIAKNREEG